MKFLKRSKLELKTYLNPILLLFSLPPFSSLVFLLSPFRFLLVSNSFYWFSMCWSGYVQNIKCGKVLGCEKG